MEDNFSNSWVLIILFALIFGFNGNGFGGNNGAAQQEILYNQHFNALDNKMDRGFTSIGNGIADATFALNNAITGEGRHLQTQLSESTASVNATTVAQTQKILDALTTNRMADMQNQINQLQLNSALCGVVRYPNAMTYNAGGSPFCGGCGCGNYNI